MNTKPDITDEDIRGSMNFDGLLRDVTTFKLRQAKIYNRVKLLTTSALVILIGGLAYFVLKTSSSPRPNHGQATAHPGAIKSDPVSAPLVQAVKPLGQNDSENAASATSSHKRAYPRIPVAKTIVKAVFVNAEPLTGFPDFYEFINRELLYPAAASADSIRGVVTIRFRLNEKGDAESFTIVNSLCPSCDNEALRVLKKMPAWKPATMDGKPVSSDITIPVTFSIPSDKKQR